MKIKARMNSTLAQTVAAAVRAITPPTNTQRGQQELPVAG